jgi:hypothetical protein
LFEGAILQEGLSESTIERLNREYSAFNEETYKGEYYSQIDRLVLSSKIFKASSVNDNIFLKSKIAKILKRCLAKRPSQRYQCCEDLIKDLNDTGMLFLTEMDKYEDGQRRFEVIERGALGEINPTAIMQNLLFENTLLKWVPKTVSNINVLVVGGGTYAQKFIDVCLQMGQIAGYSLRVDVVSDEIDYDRSVYLQFRPAIDQFVNINNSLNCSLKEEYGEVNFGVESWGGSLRKDTEFSKYNLELNKKNAEKLMERNIKESTYQYIFIALGDDTLNRYVADAFVDVCEEINHNCSVNYVVETNIGKEKTKGNPVDINAPLELGTIHKDLERWGFNSHLQWKKPSNIDQEVVKEFREKYNYESSLAFALSIRYKLHSIGIEDDDSARVAEKLKKVIEKKESSYYQLINFEHRRWVIDRLTDGWTGSLEAVEKINYDRWVRKGNLRAKDEKRKMHLCIAHSTNETPSLDDKWDAPEVDNRLDELDQVSVRLHQALKKYAEEIIAENPNYEEIPIIKKKLVEIKENMYCNYKSYDEELIKNIPKILMEELPANINFGGSPQKKSSREYETYSPKPIDTEGVVLPKGWERDEHLEVLAENKHDVWALERIREGWRNGEKKNDDLLINPLLIPYSELPESEKEQNRKNVVETLKLVTKIVSKNNGIEE